MMVSSLDAIDFSRLCLMATLVYITQSILEKARLWFFKKFIWFIEREERKKYISVKTERASSTSRFHLEDNL